MSQFKVHLFKGTLEKFLDQNSYHLIEFFKFDVGRHRLGPNEFKNGKIQIFPKDPERGYVPHIKLNEGEGLEVNFYDLHFDGTGTVGSKKGTFFGYIKSMRINFRFAPIVKDDHPIDLIPDVRVERVFVDFDRKNMGITVDSEEASNPGISNHIQEWVRNSIERRASEIRKKLIDLHNSIADLISSKIDTKKFLGKVRLSKLHFYEDFVDIALRFSFPKYEDSDLKTKTGQFKDEHLPNQQGIEIVLDENVINTLIYGIYNLDYKLSMRQDLGGFLEANPDIEYFFKVRNLLY